MHCLTEEIIWQSSFHWFVLLAIGVAGDETITHEKILMKPDGATSQKKKKKRLIFSACRIELFPEINKTPFYVLENAL